MPIVYNSTIKNKWSSAMSAGIYCLSFEGTDKVYIGKSVNLDSRAYSHHWNMQKQKAPKKLQDAYNIYGAPIFTVLEYCNEAELYCLEKLYINEFNSVEDGFNYSPGGEGGNVSPGDSNSRAVGTNTQYLEALELLVYTNMSRYEIANATGLTSSIVSHISSGEGHKWLKDAAPELYSKLLEIKSSGRVKRTNNSNRPFNKLISPDNITHDMSDVRLKEFCIQHSLTYSKISQVLNGHTEQHKGWKAAL